MYFSFIHDGQSYSGTCFLEVAESIYRKLQPSNAIYYANEDGDYFLYDGLSAGWCPPPLTAELVADYLTWITDCEKTSLRVEAGAVTTTVAPSSCTFVEQDGYYLSPELHSPGFLQLLSNVVEAAASERYEVLRWFKAQNEALLDMLFSESVEDPPESDGEVDE